MNLMYKCKEEAGLWVCLICGKSTEHPGPNKTVSLLSVRELAYCTPGKRIRFSDNKISTIYETVPFLLHVKSQ